MAATKYTKSVTDFLNSKIDSTSLTNEIAQSAITIALDYIDTNVSTCDIWFKDELSENEVVLLNALVAAHEGIAPINTNYDDNGNQVVATSVYAFTKEKTKFKGFRYVATAGQTTIFDEEAAKQIYIQGGKGNISNAADGDYVEFAIVDKDDVLGLFGGLGLTVGQDVLEIDKYVETYYPSPGVLNEIELRVQAAGKLVPGLYLRLIYHSTGNDTDPVIRLTYLWYEASN